MSKLDEEIRIETEEWQKLGLSGNHTVHSPESLWMVKVQLQAMINLLIDRDVVTEKELNFEMKQIMLEDMRTLRDQVSEDSKIIGSDGKSLKL